MVKERHGFPDLMVPFGTTVSVGYLRKIFATIKEGDDNDYHYVTIKEALRCIINSDHTISLDTTQETFVYDLAVIGHNPNYAKRTLAYFRYNGSALVEYRGDNHSIDLPDDVSYLIHKDGVDLVCDEETKMLIRLSMS